MSSTLTSDSTRDGAAVLVPFAVDVPEADLDDLHRRLDATVWPGQRPDAGWSRGTDLDYLRRLVKYWREEFDWRAAERRINKLSHYIADIDGISVHFSRTESVSSNSIPLLVLHGWPSSFAEMDKLIGRLADPTRYGGEAGDGFDVIVPSLPGFIFSELYPATGMDLAGMARVLHRLMEELGFRKYAVHGGDVGAGVAAALSSLYPEAVLGIHVTSVALVSPAAVEDERPLTDAESAYVEGRKTWMGTEGAYYQVQSTKPQSLSYGLTDSPVGLAAWVAEKFHAWSDTSQGFEKTFTMDELLTTISLYWFTHSIGSASEFYFESRAKPLVLKRDVKLQGVNGVAVFPADISLPPREWAERIMIVSRYTAMPRGGHFAALEEPDLLAQEIRHTFRPLRAATASDSVRRP